MTKSTIRLGRQTDLEKIRYCVDQAFSPFIAAVGQKPAPMLEDYSTAMHEHHLVVAEQAGEICGILLLNQQDDCLWLDVLAVDPQYQGQGISSQLLRYTETYAQERSLQEIRLFTNVKFETAQLVYIHKGYQEYERRLEYGYERIYYQKILH